MSFQEHKITEYAASIAALPDKIENRAEWLKKQFDARTDSEVKDKQKQNDCNGESCFMRTFGGIFIAAEKHVNKIGKKIKTSAKQEAA